MSRLTFAEHDLQQFLFPISILTEERLPGFNSHRHQGNAHTEMHSQSYAFLNSFYTQSDTIQETVAQSYRSHLRKMLLPTAPRPRHFRISVPPRPARMQNVERSGNYT